MLHSIHRVLAGAVCVTAACFFALPSASVAYSLLSGSLGLGTSGNGYQRDVRVYNNALDPSANSNKAAEIGYPGADGAVLASWKAATAWNSDKHNAGKNFDFDFQGSVTSAGDSDSNTVSWTYTLCGGGTLAYTLTPIANGWAIRLCEGWVWANGPGEPAPGQIDIQGIVAHELGHALGLGHSSVGCGGDCGNDATMCAYLCGSGSNFRSLEADDLAGLEAIYGARPPGKPEITGLSGSMSNGNTLIVKGKGFPPSVNVKFTSKTTQDTGAIQGVVYGVAAAAQQLTVTIPTAARDGNVLIWVPESSLLSNPFPIDIGGAPPTPPAIYGIAPAVVAALGGNTVTLSGSAFTGALRVEVGPATLLPGAGFVIQSDSSIAFAPPPAQGSLDPVPVIVATAGGSSAQVTLSYVETSPLLLLGPPHLGNGSSATYTWGGKPGQLAILLAGGQNATVDFQGAPLLCATLWLLLPQTDAAGIGSLCAPIDNLPLGVDVCVQIATLAPPGTDLGSVALSNIHVAKVLF
ncbi:MAG: IPT/TIG domain-containing protein [Planctomycetes bacterium]|nr:IPT/TIG domain-containing protein [Planctomycetota bacterium]